MTRRNFRILMVVILAVLSAFAIWSWTRPYEWRPDAGAGCVVVAAGLQRDHSYHWLDLRLKVRGGNGHDLRKPVFLETAGRPRVEPADTTLSGDAENPIDELFLRFWLEPGDLDGPLSLHLNDGVLSIRTGHGEPRLDREGRAVFHTRRW